MEKKVTRKNIDWIAISRVTNVLALRNTFHSVYQLQGSAAAEHPTKGVVDEDQKSGAEKKVSINSCGAKF